MQTAVISPLPNDFEKLVAEMLQVIDPHLPDALGKGAALIGAGVAMLAAEQGEEGLNLAICVTQGAVLGAAEKLGLGSVQ